MAKFVDITGQKFNKLLCLELVQTRTNKYNRTVYRFRCDCGVEKEIEATSVKTVDTHNLPGTVITPKKSFTWVEIDNVGILTFYNESLILEEVYHSPHAKVMSEIEE